MVIIWLSKRLLRLYFNYDFCYFLLTGCNWWIQSLLRTVWLFWTAVVEVIRVMLKSKCLPLNPWHQVEVKQRWTIQYRDFCLPWKYPAHSNRPSTWYFWKWPRRMDEALDSRCRKTNKQFISQLEPNSMTPVHSYMRNNAT